MINELQLKFHKRYGVHYHNNLISPSLHPIESLVLPIGSVLHIPDYREQYVVGPDSSHPLLLSQDKTFYVRAISQYAPNWLSDAVRIKQMQIAPLVRGYIVDNPTFKRLKVDPNELTPVNRPALITYSLLHQLHIYREVVGNVLNHWLNHYATVFYQARILSADKIRHHYIPIRLPSRFPSAANLRAAESGLDKTLIRRLTQADAWLISSIWNLIAGANNAHIFKDMQADDLSHVSIIWTTDTEFSVLNLGTLLNFADGDNAKVTKLNLQRQFVKYLIELNAQSREIGVTHDDIDDVVESEEVDVDDPDEYDAQPEDEAELESVDDFSDINPFASKPKRFGDDVLLDSSEIVLDDDDGQMGVVDDNDDFEKRLSAVATDVDEEDTPEDESTNEDKIAQAYNAYNPVSLDAEDVLEARGRSMVRAGVLAEGSLNRLKKMGVSAGMMRSPIDKNKTIDEFRVITKEDITIPETNPLGVESEDVLDESMLSSSLTKFNKTYVTSVYQKDVINMVMGIQKGGVVIKNYDVERVETINDKYDIHKVQIETLRGHTSTLNFKIPVVEADGTFISGGSRRYMRKQRGDVPIRKVGPTSVALTSYYSKMFVDLSERSAFNRQAKLQEHVVAAAISGDTNIGDIKFSDVFVHTMRLPRTYTMLAKKFSSFEVGEHRLYFNYNAIETNIGVKPDKKYLPLAINKTTGEVSLYLSMDDKDRLFDGEKRALDQTLFDLLGVDLNKLPTEYAELKIFSKKFPLVLILGYHLGFGNLLKTLGVEPVRYAKGKRIALQSYEYILKFRDESLVFDKRTNLHAHFILTGLLRSKQLLRTISVYDLDKQSVYTDLFEQLKTPIRFLREAPDMFNMWVDPITQSILEEMGEPTDLVLLFIRAAELLTNDEHPAGMNLRYMRDKGYERVSGILYGELTKAIRTYNSNPLYNNNKLTLHPEVVWYGVVADQSVALVEESNPIHNLKESEVIIYSGAGGRSGQTMTGETRLFHPSNIGVTSESTSDSGDAGATVYNVADPNYTTVRGLSRDVEDLQDTGAAKLLSPSGLLAVGATHCDPKRANFIGIHNSQSTFINGSTQLPVRTGMEKVIHTRVGAKFAEVGKKDGRVLKVDAKSIQVEYVDGEREAFAIGRAFGRWNNYHLPHILTANVTAGEAFSAGHCLYYNEHYFCKDYADNGNIAFKNQVLARVAFVENYTVYEDSAAMSKSFSTKMETGLTHVRDVRLTSDQVVRNLVEIGDPVDSDTILCTVHNGQIEDSMLSSGSAKSLEMLGTLNPKAKYSGTVERIEVLYACDLEDMDERLAETVIEADARLYKEAKRIGSQARSGRVDAGFKIKGAALLTGDVIIRVYVTENVGMSAADKIDVSNQLKATVTNYYNDNIHSEDGTAVDLLFSAKSVDNRVVLDAELIGTTSTLCVAMTNDVVNAYFNQ